MSRPIILAEKVSKCYTLHTSGGIAHHGFGSHAFTFHRTLADTFRSAQRVFGVGTQATRPRTTTWRQWRFEHELRLKTQDQSRPGVLGIQLSRDHFSGHAIGVPAGR
jgi:hypothetical protein